MSVITSTPYYVQVNTPFQLQPYGSFGKNQWITDPTVINAILASSSASSVTKIANPDYQRPTGVLALAPETDQAVTANGQTITVDEQGTVVLTTALGAGVTGLILQKGTVSGQKVVILNNSAQSMTFAAVGTSFVQGGTGTSVAAGVGKEFQWNTGTTSWWQL